MKRPQVIFATLALLGGCTQPQAVTSVATGLSVLSDLATTACAVQSLANQLGNSAVSTAAGKLCTW